MREPANERGSTESKLICFRSDLNSGIMFWLYLNAKTNELCPVVLNEQSEFRNHQDKSEWTRLRELVDETTLALKARVVS